MSVDPTASQATAAAAMPTVSFRFCTAKVAGEGLSEVDYGTIVDSISNSV